MCAIFRYFGIGLDDLSLKAAFTALLDLFSRSPSRPSSTTPSSELVTETSSSVTDRIRYVFSSVWDVIAKVGGSFWRLFLASGLGRLFQS